MFFFLISNYALNIALTLPLPYLSLICKTWEFYCILLIVKLLNFYFSFPCNNNTNDWKMKRILFHALGNASFSRLYCYAQKHVKSIRAVTKLPDTSMAKSFRSKSSRCKPPKPQTKTKPTSPYHVSDHKAAITVGVIMGVFLVCWVPFFCVNIVAAYCKTCISHRAFQVRFFCKLQTVLQTPKLFVSI